MDSDGDGDGALGFRVLSRRCYGAESNRVPTRLHSNSSAEWIGLHSTMRISPHHRTLIPSVEAPSILI